MYGHNRYYRLTCFYTAIYKRVIHLDMLNSRRSQQLVLHRKTMKLLSCLLFIAVLAMSQGQKPHYDLNDAPSLFEKFMKDYNRNYKDEADKDVHYKEFVKTLEKINKLNAESSSATFDINNFADYTPEQRKNLRGLKLPDQEKK